MNPSPLPFDALDPDAVLGCVEALGVRTDGRLLALNSYENRVYQVGVEDGVPLIAKFYRPARWSDAQIAEEHAFLAELVAAEVPAVAPLAFASRTLHSRGGYRYALFPRRGGRAPDLSLPAHLEWLGRFIARIHAVGRTQRFAHRLRLDPAARCAETIAFVEANAFAPEYLRPAWSMAARELADGIGGAFEGHGALATLRLHGDCHPGNVMWTDAGPHFVDFDDSRSGPAVQDFWMLLSGDEHAMGLQLGKFLAGYELFREFDDRELQLIEALRTLRLIHYSAWIARRWEDPAFPAAFPWFDTPRYWQDRILELREQIALMNEAPLQPV